ncbi:helix-turn-helix transcriptional regulator [Nocardioides ochotonae]|uniref:helix-turn-helix transcriptional regulator n=1 Tax=Nocardioides ochotonae TaxID=2685869 RepID=UPI001A9F05C3
MAASRPSEDQEWVTSRIESWVETYKKSMLTPVVLNVVDAHGPAGVADIARHIAASTGWQLTERGLYRTLKRLEDSGLLASIGVDAPRTGAKRKELSLTPLGAAFLDGARAHLVELSTAEATPELPET